MFLIDTNVLSELRRLQDGRGHPAVTAWAARQDPDTFYLSAITIFETEMGILRMERRDPAQGRRLRDWWTLGILPRHSARILPVDERVAVVAAAFHVPDPAPLADSLIAATALVHGMVMVTRNARDFRVPGLAVLDPWAG